MLYLDSTELIENPGKSLRRVAIFMDVPQIINENNFYFDDEKGKYKFWKLLRGYPSWNEAEPTNFLDLILTILFWKYGKFEDDW